MTIDPRKEPTPREMRNSRSGAPLLKRGPSFFVAVSFHYFPQLRLNLLHVITQLVFVTFVYEIFNPGPGLTLSLG
jgi:hypothetical protein